MPRIGLGVTSSKPLSVYLPIFKRRTIQLVLQDCFKDNVKVQQKNCFAVCTRRKHYTNAAYYNSWVQRFVNTQLPCRKDAVFKRRKRQAEKKKLHLRTTISSSSPSLKSVLALSLYFSPPRSLLSTGCFLLAFEGAVCLTATGWIKKVYELLLPAYFAAG